MAWSWLQSASAQGSTGLTVTFTTANCTAGSKLIAAVAGDNSSLTTVSSVKDAAGNAMTSLGSVTLGDGTGTVTLLAMDTPAADVGIKPTFTLTMSVGGGSAAMLVQEVSGLLTGNTTAMIDGTAGTATGSASGTTTNPTYSSHAANEYLVVLYGDAGNSITYTAPGSPWTGDPNGINTSFNDDIVISYRNSTGGTETGQYSINGGVQWGVLMVAFKLPGATGNGPAFYPFDFPARAKIPGRPAARGVYMGVGNYVAGAIDRSYGTGQIQWNAGGPVVNPPPEPTFGPLPNRPAIVVINSGWRNSGHSR